VALVPPAHPPQPLSLPPEHHRTPPHLQFAPIPQAPPDRDSRQESVRVVHAVRRGDLGDGGGGGEEADGQGEGREVEEVDGVGAVRGHACIDFLL